MECNTRRTALQRAALRLQQDAIDLGSALQSKPIALADWEKIIGVPCPAWLKVPRCDGPAALQRAVACLLCGVCVCV